LQREVVTRGVVATISGTTVWRWLAADAIRQWRHHSWLFPRDPDFATKAGPILDLYAGVWAGEPLAADDDVLSADEKRAFRPAVAAMRHARPDPITSRKSNMSIADGRVGLPDGVGRPAREALRSL
jgi:hypothetical protein